MALFPSLDKKAQSYFEFNPEECKTLQQMKTKKEFKTWFDEIKLVSRKISLLLCGTPWQLKEAVELKIEGAWPKNLTLARFCTKALEIGAFASFLRVLSFCAQQQIAWPWMFEKGRRNTPKNLFSADKKAIFYLLRELKKHPWVHEIPDIHAAFAPIVFQNNLYKIVSRDKSRYGEPEERPKTKKALKEFQDLHVIFV